VLPKGNYSVNVDNREFKSIFFYSISRLGQIVLSPMVLTEDNAIVTGKVLNDENAPVQLANLTAQKEP